MLIEYKIKFEEDGVTVTQRVDQGASNGAGSSTNALQRRTGRILGPSFQQTKASGPVDDVAGPVDDVAGPVDDVAGPVDDVAGPVDDVGRPLSANGSGSFPIVILGPLVIGPIQADKGRVTPLPEIRPAKNAKTRAMRAAGGTE